MVDKAFILKVLNQQMVESTGCTEPAAVSYASSIAASELKKLGASIDKITLLASKNVLKNAMSAGLPNSDKVGVNFAAGIGAIHGNPQNKLNVNNDVDKETYSIVEKMIHDGKISVDVAKAPNVLYIEAIVEGDGHKARAIIKDAHTNVTFISVDDKVVLENVSDNASNELIPFSEISEKLTLRDIYDFAVSILDVDNDPIDILRLSEKINGYISKRGLETDYGLNVGRNIKKDIDEGLAADNYVTHAVMKAVAASDARMAGAPYSVVTNSGSGNQGITNVVPIISLADDLGVSTEKKLRALALGNLTSIFIKSKFGTLSAFCGAAIASTGAATGITYLRGGDYDAYEKTIINMIGTVTGMICDGAKPDCSLKIYAGLQGAFNASTLALRGIRVDSTEGIVCATAEDSINNICELSRNCSETLDENILKMMINK
ncbi:MAG: serine dehydratase subunit alpha family protein [Lachnospiraceae bacterium]|nr:serine dehydratase subunit alpha family protein [Lachnospiraceae bacterium]